MTGNDWNRSELLVMETLKEIKNDTKSNSKEIVSLKVEVAKIAIRVGVISAMATTILVNVALSFWHAR